MIRMAGVPDLGKSCLESRLEHGGRVAGPELKTGAQVRLPVIGCIVGELNAEMSSARKAGPGHRLVDARGTSVSPGPLWVPGPALV